MIAQTVPQTGLAIRLVSEGTTRLGFLKKKKKHKEIMKNIQNNATENNKQISAIPRLQPTKMYPSLWIKERIFE